jgi:hypothetical protein
LSNEKAWLFKGEVFESKPKYSKALSVILNEADSKWAGLLRPHNIHSEDITANASIPIELIALSKGIRLPNILNDLFFFF